MKKVITFGTFDLLHYGHINYLSEAKTFGDYLIVGVASNETYYKLKNYQPIFDETQRVKIIQSISYVDFAFVSSHFCQTDMNKIIERYEANIVIIGEDNKRNTKDFECPDVYRIKRVHGVSSSEIKLKIAERYITKSCHDKCKIITEK